MSEPSSATSRPRWAHRVADPYRTVVEDLGAQAATMHERLADARAGEALEVHARLGQVVAAHADPADGELPADEVVHGHALRDQVPARLLLGELDPVLVARAGDGLTFDQRDGALADLRARVLAGFDRIPVTVEPLAREREHLGARLHRLTLTWCHVDRDDRSVEGHVLILAGRRPPTSRHSTWWSTRRRFASARPAPRSAGPGPPARESPRPSSSRPLRIRPARRPARRRARRARRPERPAVGAIGGGGVRASAAAGADRPPPARPGEGQDQRRAGSSEERPRPLRAAERGVSAVDGSEDRAEAQCRDPARSEQQPEGETGSDAAPDRDGDGGDDREHHDHEHRRPQLARHRFERRAQPDRESGPGRAGTGSSRSRRRHRSLRACRAHRGIARRRAAARYAAGARRARRGSQR